MYNEKEFVRAISLSYKKYIEHGARSTEKLKPIQNLVAQPLQNIFGTQIGRAHV